MCRIHEHMSMHATVYSSGAALYQCGLIGSGVQWCSVICGSSCATPCLSGTKKKLLAVSEAVSPIHYTTAHHAGLESRVEPASGCGHDRRTTRKTQVVGCYQCRSGVALPFPCFHAQEDSLGGSNRGYQPSNPVPAPPVD